LSIVEILFLAVALGVDCLVVSFSQGLILFENRVKNSLKLAFVMGIFQGCMPIIGYTGANSMYENLLPFSKWIVFWIFFILGVKFILDSFKPKGIHVQCFDINCLVGLGLATSIDALVSGASLRLLHAYLPVAVIIIGITSFFMSMAGFWGGNFLKKLSPKSFEVTGGVILILLAFKALFIG
jgi:putative Mn2+ efflux pump MntP